MRCPKCPNQAMRLETWPGVEFERCPRCQGIFLDDGELERMLVRSGIILIKYWFSVTREEQHARFESRETDPLKQWKLSPIDMASLDKWDKYTEAKEAMFFYTDTADAPWTIIKSDDKKRARLNCMQHFLSGLDYPDKDSHVVHGPDPLIVGSSGQVISKDQHLWS